MPDGAPTDGPGSAPGSAPGSTPDHPPDDVPSRAPGPVLRVGIVLGLTALALLCVAWEIWLAPLRPGAWLLSLKALPIVIALPALWRGRLKTFQLWSMLILAYMAEGLVRGASDTNRLSAMLGWIEAGLAATIFVAILVWCKRSKTSRTV